VACPTWPACNGQWIVSLSDPALAAAWGHRFVTLVVGLLLLGTMVVAWIRPSKAGSASRLASQGVLYRDKSSSVHSPRSPGRRRYCRLLTSSWGWESSLGYSSRSSGNSSESAPSVAVTETEPAAPAGDLNYDGANEQPSPRTIERRSGPRANVTSTRVCGADEAETHVVALSRWPRWGWPRERASTRGLLSRR